MNTLPTAVLAAISGAATYFALRSPDLEVPVPQRSTVAVITSATGTKAIVLLCEFLPRATPAELAALATGFGRTGSAEPDTTAAWAALLTQWTSTAPDAALASTPPDRLPLLFRSWATHDLSGAVSAARAHGAGSLNSLINSLGNDSLALAENLLPEERMEHNIRNRAERIADLKISFEASEGDGHEETIREFANETPKELLTLIEAISDERKRTDALRQFLEDLDYRSPESLSHARTAIAGLPNGRSRSELLSYVARQTGVHGTGALAWAESLPPGDARDAAISAALADQARDDPEAYFNTLDRIGWRTDLGNAIGRKLTATAGAESRDGGWGSGSINDNLRNAFAALVDRGDIGTALAAAANIHDPDTAKWVIAGTLETWSKADPGAALGFLLDAPHDDSGVVHELMEESVRTIVWSDPEEALARFASITAPEARRFVGDSLAWELSAKDPTLATTWWSSLPLVDRVAQSDKIANGIARSDPAAAAALAPGMPKLFTRRNYGTITESWMERDPTAASQWVSTLPPGGNRDIAIGTLVNSLTTGNGADFTSAIRWAETISSPDRRTVALDKIEARIAR